mmetsp:Transcript_23806/g.55521  ORF Transcript_23806/g.55521 Transcript_23806/m.55521 type:complete len:210 (+) Transcript_23806:673-1302(+)
MTRPRTLPLVMTHWCHMPQFSHLKAGWTTAQSTASAAGWLNTRTIQKACASLSRHWRQRGPGGESAKAIRTSSRLRSRGRCKGGRNVLPIWHQLRWVLAWVANPRARATVTAATGRASPRASSRATAVTVMPQILQAPLTRAKARSMARARVRARPRARARTRARARPSTSSSAAVMMMMTMTLRAMARARARPRARTRAKARTKPKAS